MFMQPPRAATVLIVDDDPSSAQALGSCLQTSGLEARATASAEWPEMVESVRPDAIVLSPGPHGSEALQLCRLVREATRAPIVLMAVQAGHRAAIQGLDAGADVCVPVPGTPELVLAYVQALLRRRHLDRMVEERALQIRNLRLDLDRREALLYGQRLTLTPTEFRLLWSLAINAGRVVSSDQLLEMAQGYRCGEQEAQEIVKVHVGHLRNKLHTPADELPYILTVRGFGYMLERRAKLRSDRRASVASLDSAPLRVPSSADLPPRPVDNPGASETSIEPERKGTLAASG